LGVTRRLIRVPDWAKWLRSGMSMACANRAGGLRQEVSTPQGLDRAGGFADM